MQDALSGQARDHLADQVTHQREARLSDEERGSAVHPLATGEVGTVPDQRSDVSPGLELGDDLHVPFPGVRDETGELFHGDGTGILAAEGEAVEAQPAQLVVVEVQVQGVQLQARRDADDPLEVGERKDAATGIDHEGAQRIRGAVDDLQGGPRRAAREPVQALHQGLAAVEKPGAVGATQESAPRIQGERVGFRRLQRRIEAHRDRPRVGGADGRETDAAELCVQRVAARRRRQPVVGAQRHPVRRRKRRTLTDIPRARPEQLGERSRIGAHVVFPYSLPYRKNASRFSIGVPSRMPSVVPRMNRPRRPASHERCTERRTSSTEPRCST